MIIPNEDKRIECEIKDGELKLCDSLDSKLSDDSPNSHKKGFTAISIFNMKTGNYRFIGVAYKPDAKDRGSMLNYCSWCGKKIQNWDDKDE